MTEPRTYAKFNKRCLWDKCENWARADQIFCPADYRALPMQIQIKLWPKGTIGVSGAAIDEAIQYLDDKRNNALIVREEGP